MLSGSPSHLTFDCFYSQDPLRKKGAQLTADKKMYEEQLRDLNEQEDDESLPFEEAKKYSYNGS